MVTDVNWCVYSFIIYWLWDTTWGKLMSMQLQKYIDWKLLIDTNSWVRDFDTINIVSIQSYIPMSHLLYEMEKYPYDTVCMVAIQSKIPLRHFTLREVSIYNHWLVSYTRPLTKIMTGMTCNIQWRGVYLDMTRLSMQLQSHFWHWGWTWGDWRNIPI